MKIMDSIAIECVIVMAYLLSFINVETSSTGAILSFPHLIDGDFHNTSWEVQPATFGFADYDGISEAYLVLPKNISYHSECGDGEPAYSNEYLSVIKSYQGSDTLWILVIDRSQDDIDCSFAKQVYNAQRLGASGVIMLDYHYEGFFTMSQDSNFEHDITIPSVMLKRIYGEQLMQHLGVQNWDPTNINSTTYPEPIVPLNDSFVITKVRIEWGLPHENNIVEWQMWTSANDDKTIEFKKNFKSVCIILSLFCIKQYL